MELYFTRKMSQFPELVLPISYPSVFPVTLMLSGESTDTPCAIYVPADLNCSVKGLYTLMEGRFILPFCLSKRPVDSIHDYYGNCI